jgi:hypothetical protein
MDWIFDHFQIVILIGLAAASWLKRRADSKAERAAEEEARRELAETPVEEIFGDEEPWLAPSPSVPPPLQQAAVPPPLTHHVTVTPPPLEPPPAFENHDFDVLLQRQQDMEERLKEIRQIKKAKPAAPNARLLAPAGSRPASGHKSLNCYRKALRNPREIRQAIVMREILGPPLGLPKQ